MSEILNAPKNDKKEKKPRMSLVPLDLIEELLPPAYEEGTEKYLQESWRLGFSQSKIFDSLQRHANAYYYKSEDYDPDPLAMKYKKHHLGGVIFAALSLYLSGKTRPDLDDRPLKLLEKAKETLREKAAESEQGPYAPPAETRPETEFLFDSASAGGALSPALETPQAPKSNVSERTCYYCGYNFSLDDAASVVGKPG